MNLFSADISLWRFPASLILAAAFLVALWAADRYCARTRIVRALAAPRTAVWLIAATATALVIEGIRAAGLYHTWPFIALVLLLTAALGLAVLKRLHTRPGTGFLLSHTGLFLILWGALFGAPDTTRARMIVHQGEQTALAYTASGEAIPLPFGVRLDRFAVERYDDGTPRRFRSEVRFDGHPEAIEVNAPVRYGGYTFYQDGYDTRHGAYTVLLAVRDPWLGVVWAGIALLAAGAVTLLFDKR